MKAGCIEASNAPSFGSLSSTWWDRKAMARQHTKNRPMSRPVNPRVADIHAKIAPQDATMKGINFESGNLTKKYADAG